MQAFSQTRAPLLLFLSLMGIFCLLGSVREAQAQSKEMAVGFGLGLLNSPQEKDFSRTSQSNDVYFDWLQLRLGYNKISSYMNVNIYEADWAIKLQTQSYYAAWRYYSDEQSPFYVLAGLTFSQAKLRLGNGVPNQSTQDYGYLYGAGALMDMDSFFLGVQAIAVSAKSKMTDINVATGSSQVQITTRIPF